MGAANGVGGLPTGIGWAVGYALGAGVGVVAWVVSGEFTMGLIVFAATGTALGAAVEGSLDTRPLTPTERRVALLAAVGGVTAGILLFLSLVLLA